VAPRVDFVGPTVRFPAVQRARVSLRKGSSEGSVDPTFLRKLYNIGTAKSSSSANRQARMHARAPRGANADDDVCAAQGVASFLGQFYDANDLQSFFQQFDPQSVGRVPEVVGPNTDSNPGIEVRRSRYCTHRTARPWRPPLHAHASRLRCPTRQHVRAQAMLDIEYIMAIGQGVASQFWSTNGSQPHNPEVPRRAR
jgi:hypothetical protein